MTTWGTPKLDLPVPECSYGYPEDQLKSILGDKYKDFNKWMVGQTISRCSGSYYDAFSSSYRRTNCGPHGLVVYFGDVQRYMLGLPVID